MISAHRYIKQTIGIFFWVLFLLTTTHAASFDCSKATSEVEKIICGDSELSMSDDSLNKAYSQALGQGLFKEQTIRSQRQWVKKVRNACKDAECLKIAYQIRLSELGLLSPHRTKILTPPDEAGFSVKGRNEKHEVYFRGRYSSVEPYNFQGTTYIVVNSYSEDTKDYVAVLKPLPDGTFQKIGLFRRVSENF